MKPSASAGSGAKRPRTPGRAILWAMLALFAVGAFTAVWLRHRPGPAGPGKPDREDARVLRDAARSYRANGMFAQAEEVIRRWRAQYPDDVEAHLSLIDLSLLQERLPGAIDGAREALRLKPDAHDLRGRLAVWLFMVGCTDEAAAACRRCRQARPHDPMLAFLEADIAVKRGDTPRAVQLLEALLAEQPKHAAALVLRGALYLDANEPEKAVPLLRQAVAQGGPGQRRARHYLSLALARTGQEEEAKKLAAEVQRQHTVELWEKYGKPDSAAYKVSIAESLLDTGQADEAVRLLEQVIAESPNPAAAHRLLARYYEGQRQPEKAAAHRRKAGD